MSRTQKEYTLKVKDYYLESTTPMLKDSKKAKLILEGKGGIEYRMSIPLSVGHVKKGDYLRFTASRKKSGNVIELKYPSNAVILREVPEK